MVLPLNMEMIIPADDSIRLPSEIMDQLDYTELYKAYCRRGRRSAAAPKKQRIAEAAEKLFYQLVEKLNERKEIDFTYFETAPYFAKSLEVGGWIGEDWGGCCTIPEPVIFVFRLIPGGNNIVFMVLAFAF